MRSRRQKRWEIKYIVTQRNKRERKRSNRMRYTRVMNTGVKVISNETGLTSRSTGITYLT